MLIIFFQTPFHKSQFCCWFQSCYRSFSWYLCLELVDLFLSLHQLLSLLINRGEVVLGVLVCSSCFFFCKWKKKFIHNILAKNPKNKIGFWDWTCMVSWIVYFVFLLDVCLPMLVPHFDCHFLLGLKTNHSMHPYTG